MIERLQRALEHVEELSPEAQEELAQQIEELTAPLEYSPLPHMASTDDSLPKSVQVALSLAGAWSDLQDDDEFAAFERMRHETPPTPPIEEQLAWLEDDEPDQRSQE